MIESLTPIARTFFEKMHITIESLTIIEQEADTYKIDIQTPDSSLLIGLHGQNMQTLSHLLGRMAEKLAGKYINIHLEVNDYMKEKDARFFRYLDSRIEMVMKTGKDVSIPNLNSYERKRAHDYISAKNITGLRTYSQGEGTERMLHIASDGIITPKVVAPQARTEITIEEDGVGI